MENLSFAKSHPDFVQLQQTILRNQTQTEGIMKEMENIYWKIDKISNWISTRFGASLFETFEDFNATQNASNSTNILKSNNDLTTKSQRKNSKSTFHQRSLQIRASIRKRKSSSISQESAVNRYVRLTPQENDNNAPPFQANSVSVIVQRHHSHQDDQIASNSKTISLKQTELTPSKINDDTSLEVIAGDADLANASQKRGRPKKSAGEKAQNYKNKTPMVCDQCGKVLKGPSSLRSHKQTHSNERPFKCDQCSKAFRMKHHLDFHLLTHEGDKKWTCRFCNRGFIAQRDLMRHERTHTGERPFPCTYPNCTKSFNVKQHLTLHIRTHTGERPYKCLICNKTFTQANSLRIHKKIHVKGESTEGTGLTGTN